MKNLARSLVEIGIAGLVLVGIVLLGRYFALTPQAHAAYERGNMICRYDGEELVGFSGLNSLFDKTKIMFADSVRAAAELNIEATKKPQFEVRWISRDDPFAEFLTELCDEIRSTEVRRER